MEHDKKEIAMPIASISIVYYTWLVCPDLQSLGKPTQQHMFFFSSSDNFVFHAIKGKRISLIPFLHIDFYIVVIGLTMITREKSLVLAKGPTNFVGSV